MCVCACVCACCLHAAANPGDADEDIGLKNVLCQVLHYVCVLVACTQLPTPGMLMKT